jgi:hypothetical protein
MEIRTAPGELELVGEGDADRPAPGEPELVLVGVGVIEIRTAPGELVLVGVGVEEGFPAPGVLVPLALNTNEGNGVLVGEVSARNLLLDRSATRIVLFAGQKARPVG